MIIKSAALACMHTQTHTSTYIHTYKHTNIHTYMHAYIQVHTYIHTYIHTHRHIQVHTYIHPTHTSIHPYIHFCAQTDTKRFTLKTTDAQHPTRFHSNQSHEPAENVYALEGLACRKRVAQASSPAAPASRVRRSRRLCSTLAAAPGLLVDALVAKE